MTKIEAYHYHPYRKFIFWVVIMLSFAMLLIGDLATYIMRSQAIMSEAKANLVASATTIAGLVPIEAHESLTDPIQQNSADYKKIETEFKLIMAGNPNIRDIYTLRPTNDPHQMQFVVSGQTTGDTNGDNVITDNEIKPSLGEKYETSPYPHLEAAVNQAGADDAINYDKWGAWLSGYAPIKDANSKTVAILGIDYAAGYISGLKRDVWRSVIYLDIIILPFIFLAAWYVSRRISRPFSILAYGLERLSHGDFEHHLPTSRHREERTFEELFNRIASLFSTLKHRKPPED